MLTRRWFQLGRGIGGGLVSRPRIRKGYRFRAGWVSGLEDGSS